MERYKLNLGILTSSRADYGIYRPLLKHLIKDHNIHFSIIAFGPHLSEFYGLTKREILEDGFVINYEIETLHEIDDSSVAISKNLGETAISFSKFWLENSTTFDLVLCLGDRYEMLSAVLSSIPFNVKIAHIHGGEVTLGSIDNKFRNALTQFSDYHFTATEANTRKVEDMVGNEKKVFKVGAMGIDNVLQIPLFSKSEFYEKFGIALNSPILTTIHPETEDLENNVTNTNIFIDAMLQINDQLIITLPNSDTMGLKIRDLLLNRLSSRNDTYLVESFGTRGYFTCMHYSSFLLGNTSSGIIEAASYNKFVINLGNRQLGRERSNNVIDCPFDLEAIIDIVQKTRGKEYFGSNIYGDGQASSRIYHKLIDICSQDLI